jgi:hypothetical protein
MCTNGFEEDANGFASSTSFSGLTMPFQDLTGYVPLPEEDRQKCDTTS